MRTTWLLCLTLGATVAANAKDPKPYQSGRLMQMNSVHCGTAEKSDQSPLGEIIGTDNSSKKTQEVLCQEYVVQTDTVVYHVRPKDQKHPELLPIDSAAQFRLEKDKMLLRVEGADDKEREYFVVSMTPLSAATAQSSAAPMRSSTSSPNLQQ
jgi:hypothetical protein